MRLEFLYSLDFEAESVEGTLDPHTARQLFVWFTEATKRYEFKDRPYLQHAKFTSYYKLKKLVKVVEEVESYIKDQCFERTQVTILDTGCGIGIYASALASLGYVVKGVDTWDERIKLAKEKAKGLGNVEFEVADAKEYLESSGRHFNIVLCLDVLEHMKEPFEFCKKAYRALHSSGLFLVIIPDGLGEIELFAESFCRCFHRSSPRNPHIRRFTLGAIRRMFIEVGFDYRFVSAIYTARLPFTPLLLGGPRSRLAYLSTKIADVLPKFMTSSWLVSGIKK